MKQKHLVFPFSSQLSTPFFWYGLLWLAAFLVFGQSIGFSFSEWDDSSFILRNPLIISPGKVPLSHLFFTPEFTYIAPVTIWVEAMLYAVGKGTAFPFHLLGVLLHAVTVSLMFALARSLGQRVWIAGLCALLFAVHPIIVEPVAWSTGLKDQLMASFALLGTYLFVRETTKKQGYRGSIYFVSFLAGLCALLAKPSAVLLGGVWLVWLLSRHRSGSATNKRSWWYAGSLLFVGLLLGLASTMMRTALHKGAISKTHSGAWDSLLALGHQVAHVIWPTPLHPSYFLDRGAGFSNPLTWLGLWSVLLLIFIIWRVRNKPSQILGLGLMVAIYLPISQIIPFPRFVSDSYTYLPLVGVLITLGAWFSSARTFEALSAKEQSPRVISIVFVACLCVFWAKMSYTQTQRWSSTERLWNPVSETYPIWYYPWIHLAQGYSSKKQYRKALVDYKRAFQLDTPTQYLSSLAKNLLQNHQQNEAECVLAIDLKRGPKPHRAAQNYVLFLTFMPKYQPKYPYQAKRAFVLLHHTTQHFSPGLQKKILQREQRLLQEIKSVKERLSLSYSDCAVLKHNPQKKKENPTQK